jgi:ribosomal protein S18 acetylase RimI-like enzyme
MRVMGAASDEEIGRRLEEDRLWAAYALCDLEPEHRGFARYLLAGDDPAPPAQPDQVRRLGWCLIYTPPGFSSLVAGGHPDAMAAALDAAGALPQETVYMVPDRYPHRAGDAAAGAGPYIAALERVYRVESKRPMLRLALAAGAALVEEPRPLGDGALLCRLTHGHAAELNDLYDADPYRAFTPAMLDGVYYGIRLQGRLVAAAGTHAVSARYGLAMIGNVFTSPTARGRGYAGHTALAVVRELRELRGCRDIALNVVAGNAPALRLYRRLGFQTYMTFWEGQARR